MIGLHAARTVPSLAALVLVGSTLAACGSEEAEPAQSFPPVVADDCIVMLHGKGGNALPSEELGDVARMYPAGNGEGWGARQWSYETADDVAAGVDVIESTLAAGGCRRAVVHGFSNGGAFAAKLYCSGTSLDGRLVGVVIDDPVTDASAEGCAPDPYVDVVLYWTGGLEEFAGPGTRCSSLDWTCEGGEVIGVDAYAEALGVEVTASPLTEHDRYDDAPEPLEWLASTSG